ncbi:MAG TPA: hypothetical protein VGM44_21430, partial [Polyangiaceae bacterium]
MAEGRAYFPPIFRTACRARRARALGLGAFAALALGCAGERVTPRAVAASKPVSLATRAEPPHASREAFAPRLFPPLDGSDTISAGEERDKSQRLVAFGLRVLARPDGAVELAREYLPAARTVQSLELPPRLGAGFLFYVLSSSATLFFRAKTFTADLEPFARLEFEAE